MDEVGELDLNMQAKLLRAIEGGGFTPIGSREIKMPNFRIIAATNKDLAQCVKNGLMREDFYYRIHIIPIHLPPLRERKEDLPLLIHHFLRLYSGGNTIPSIPGNILKSMQQYDWPGNVRELQNTIHRYITLNQIDFMGVSLSGGITSSPLSSTIQTPNNTNLRFAKEAFEKQYIQNQLEEYQWHRGKVARTLGINRKTLFKKIKYYGLLKAP
jgi:transcriptional regulator with PAS, ATPase and Fis domain